MKKTRWKILVAWSLALGYLVWALQSVPVDPERLARGIGLGKEFLSGFLNPDFTSRRVDIAEGLMQSIAMAIVSTVIGGVLAVPLGLLAARNLAPAAIRGAVRGLLVVIRTFPELIIAVYCVAIFGFGPFAGMVTLVVASAGFLGKLLAEEIEGIDPGPLEAIEAAGGGWWQKVRFAVLPAVAPRTTGLWLYRLDINFRESAILGIVGAGGIGATLKTSIDRSEFGSSAAILLLIVAIVLGVEAISSRVRHRIVSGTGAASTGGQVGRAHLVPAALFGVFVLAAWVLSRETNFDYFLDVPRVFVDLAQRSVPPAWAETPKMWGPLMDTVHIATLGTLLAFVIGVPLAFLAARNTSPHPVVRWLAIAVAVGSRSVNSLIWALLLVKLIGPGLLAGVLAVGVRSIGFITKLLYESTEEIQVDPVEAVTATGAGPISVFRHAIVPQVAPACAAITLFRWDINIRESAMVGLVGAGGIGLLLNGAVENVAWREASLILLLILALVVLAEAVSNRMRRRLI